MAVSVSCPTCGHALKIPDGVYERRVAGQVAVLRCKRCKGGMKVDGNHSPPRVEKADGDGAKPEEQTPPAAPEATAKPAEAKPAQAKPAQAKPAEAKPAASAEPQRATAKADTKEPDSGSKPAEHVPASVRASTQEVDSSWSIAPPAVTSGDGKKAPADTKAKTADTKAKPADAEAKPAVTKAKTAGAQTKPAEPKPRPAETAKFAGTPKPAVTKAKPAVTKAKPAVTKAKPAATPKPALVSPKATTKPAATTPKPAAASPKPSTTKPKPAAPRARSRATRRPSGHWYVSYDDNDDRKMDAAAVGRALTRGEIDAETIVWQKGMDEWLPISEVPELAARLQGNATTARKPAGPPPPRRPAPSSPDVPSAFEGDGAHQSTHASSDDEYEIITSVRPEMLGSIEPPPMPEIPPEQTPPPMPARASVPEDAAPPPLPSAAHAAPPVKREPQKAKAEPRKAAPAAPLGGNDLLSGLASAEPATEDAVTPPPPESGGRGKLVWVIVAGLLVLAAVAAMLAFGRNHGSPASTEPATTSPAEVVAATPPPSDTARHDETAQEPTGTPTTGSPVAEPPAVKAAPPGSSAGSGSGDFLSQFAAAANQNGGSTRVGGFDKKRALDALAGPLGQARSCRRRGDPSGTAYLAIDLDPSGKVTGARVSGPLAGTPTARCIVSRIQAARVPPFSGSPASVATPVAIR